MADIAAGNTWQVDIVQLKQANAMMRSANCSGQLIPDTTLSFSSARAGASPPLNW